MLITRRTTITENRHERKWVRGEERNVSEKDASGDDVFEEGVSRGLGQSLTSSSHVTLLRPVKLKMAWVQRNGSTSSTSNMPLPGRQRAHDEK